MSARIVKQMEGIHRGNDRGPQLSHHQFQEGGQILSKNIPVAVEKEIVEQVAQFVGRQFTSSFLKLVACEFCPICLLDATTAEDLMEEPFANSSPARLVHLRPNADRAKQRDHTRGSAMHGGFV